MKVKMIYLWLSPLVKTLWRKLGREFSNPRNYILWSLNTKRTTKKTQVSHVFNIPNNPGVRNFYNFEKCKYWDNWVRVAKSVQIQAKCFRRPVICFYHKINHSAGIYLFKVNNGNTRKMCEICWKLKIKTLDV